MLKPVNQIAIGNNSGLMEASGKDKDDGLELWDRVYFTHAVTTSQVSRKVQVYVCPLRRKGEVSAASMDPRTLYCEDSLWGTGKVLLYV